jgi:hypothetical protein
MKAELVKRQDRWDLYGEDGSKIASSAPNPFKRLSIKNCEAIANGYDLDELIEESYEKHRVNDKGYSINEQIQRSGGFSIGYEEGFLKAMELIGDKKFSINEVVELCKILMSNPFEKCGKTYQELTDNYIQSLQQTEWDVEIETEEKRIGGIKGYGEYEIVPKLDADGCLILKRK